MMSHVRMISDDAIASPLRVHVSSPMIHLGCMPETAHEQLTVLNLLLPMLNGYDFNKTWMHMYDIV